MIVVPAQDVKIHWISWTILKDSSCFIQEEASFDYRLSILDYPNGDVRHYEYKMTGDGGVHTIHIDLQHSTRRLMKVQPPWSSCSRRYGLDVTASIAVSKQYAGTQSQTRFQIFSQLYRLALLTNTGKAAAENYGDLMAKLAVMMSFILSLRKKAKEHWKFVLECDDEGTEHRARPTPPNS